MTILSDSQIEEMIQPATLDTFERGIASTMHAAAAQRHDPRVSASCDIYYVPFLNRSSPYLIVNGCWSTDFKDVEIPESIKSSYEHIAKFLYPIYLEKFKPLIEPFESSLIRTVPNNLTSFKKIISYGSSSFGYDARLADELKLFTNINATVIDPKRFDERALVDAMIHEDDTGDRYVLLPPNSYLLGRTIEYFNLPRDITAVFLAKSTYARSGVLINTTPGEAGWQGHLVVEIGNLTNLPVRIYVGEGILQALFFRGNGPCNTSYADRGGKYMHQEGVVLAKV